eukprot:jgi/Mesen1/9240/ME000006S09240
MDASDGAGDRVLPATRRPDGTMRKERRVRAGYVPPDEVAVYIAKGTQPRGSAPALPIGLDPIHAAAASKAKTKAARKNEKRKLKRAEGREEESAESSSPSAATLGGSEGGAFSEAQADALPGAFADLQVSSSGSTPLGASHGVVGTTSGTATAAAGGPIEDGGSSKSELERKIRALRKKVRQAEGLKDGGGGMTADEMSKLAKLDSWRSELASLEAALPAL